MMDILSICLRNYVFFLCMVHCCCAVSKSVIKVLDMPKRIHFYRVFFMLIMIKQARLIFVNITEIVWGFTGGTGAKTVKYCLKWHNTRAQQ